MKPWATLTALALLAACQPKASNEAAGNIERLDPALDAILSANPSINVIATGHEWTEGPLWVESEHMLLFSDVPRNTIYKWTAEGGESVYLTPSGYTGDRARGGETGSNGLTLDANGRLVLCQHGDRQMARMEAPLASPAPSFVSLANAYDGKKFDSPNDAVFKSNGNLFFTDPPYGLENQERDSTKAAPYQGVYKVAVDGTVSLLVDSISRPNGIALLPGEHTLLVASSDGSKARWYAYELGENDSIVSGRVFYDATAESKAGLPGLPDGMKVDRNGNVFATGPGGIWIFDSEGKVLGKIKFEMPTSNCALADNDKTLYVTNDDNVVRITLRP